MERYPSLDLASVYAVIAYVFDHQEEVAAYTAQRRNQAQALQSEIETHSPPAGVRERWDSRELGRTPLRAQS